MKRNETKRKNCGENNICALWNAMIGHGDLLCEKMMFARIIVVVVVVSAIFYRRNARVPRQRHAHAYTPLHTDTLSPLAPSRNLFGVFCCAIMYRLLRALVCGAVLVVVIDLFRYTQVTPSQPATFHHCQSELAALVAAANAAAADQQQQQHQALASSYLDPLFAGHYSPLTSNASQLQPASVTVRPGFSGHQHQSGQSSSGSLAAAAALAANATSNLLPLFNNQSATMSSARSSPPAPLTYQALSSSSSSSSSPLSSSILGKLMMSGGGVGCAGPQPLSTLSAGMSAAGMSLFGAPAHHQHQYQRYNFRPIGPTGSVASSRHRSASGSSSASGNIMLASALQQQQHHQHHQHQQQLLMAPLDQHAHRLAAASGHTSSWCLFVYNLAPEIEESVIWKLFGPFGAVQQVNLVKDSATNKCKGFAFVTMSDYNQALMAIQSLNGYTLANRVLQVSFKTGKVRKTMQTSSSSGSGPGTVGPTEIVPSTTSTSSTTSTAAATAAADAGTSSNG